MYGIPFRGITPAILCCLIAAGIFPARASAQTAPAAASLLPSPGAKRLSLALVGGWASFSQKSVNDLIRLDNMLLTASTDDGGAGLEKGLDPLTDGLTFGAEIQYRLNSRWSIMAGFERLRDHSRITFTFDPGTGPQESFIEYEVRGSPLYAGMVYSFPFTRKFSYGVGLAAVILPSSRLSLSGSLGALASLEQKGRVSGIGAMFSWNGEIAISGPLNLVGSIRMRLGEVGNAKDSDGDKLTNPYTGDPLTIDWSGVDVLFGVIIDLM